MTERIHTNEAIDEMVARWHAGDIEQEHLHDALGWSWAEYVRWFNATNGVREGGGEPECPEDVLAHFAVTVKGAAERPALAFKQPEPGESVIIAQGDGGATRQTLTEDGWTDPEPTANPFLVGVDWGKRDAEMVVVPAVEPADGADENGGRVSLSAGGPVPLNSREAHEAAWWVYLSRWRCEPVGDGQWHVRTERGNYDLDDQGRASIFDDNGTAQRRADELNRADREQMIARLNEISTTKGDA